MDERERRVRGELSLILSGKGSAERRNFIRDIKAFLYTESRRISDLEQEALLEQKNKHVYKSY